MDADECLAACHCDSGAGIGGRVAVEPVGPDELEGRRIESSVDRPVRPEFPLWAGHSEPVTAGPTWPVAAAANGRERTVVMKGLALQGGTLPSLYTL